MKLTILIICPGARRVDVVLEDGEQGLQERGPRRDGPVDDRRQRPRAHPAARRDHDRAPGRHRRRPGRAGDGPLLHKK